MAWLAASYTEANIFAQKARAPLKILIFFAMTFETECNYKNSDSLKIVCESDAISLF